MDGRARGDMAAIASGEPPAHVPGALRISKSGPGNIREDEEEQFKKMAKHILALTDAQLSALIANGQFEEVARDG